MKIAIIHTALLASIIFGACNGSSTNKSANDVDSTSNKTTNQVNNSTTKDTAFDEIINEYLQIKNALTKDDDKAAATAGNAMFKAFEKINTSSLSAEQAKIYNDVQEDAKEHAAHIGSNEGNIIHQREHFETLSQEMYELVKVSGSEQKLYYTNCPMYNNNKGANWLSETQEISNPYLGQEMLSCGSVKEEIN